MQRLEFRAMGSKVLVLADQEEALTSIKQVPTWFEHWEQILSRFRIDSELSRLNAYGEGPCQVSSELWEVFSASVEAARLTGGLVTPLVLPDLLRAGYDRSFNAFAREVLEPARIPWMDPSPESMSSSADRDLSHLVIDAPLRKLLLPEGAGLDFGGVAKGWAAHKAMLRLSTASPTLVSAGGDIAVSGPLADGSPWVIAVEDPFQDGGWVEKIYLKAGGVATSGRDHRHWTRDGRPLHHVIDPRTGWPARTDIVSATVVSKSVMHAEALAKAVLILGSNAGTEWLAEFEGAAALIVLQSGETMHTASLEEYL